MPVWNAAPWLEEAASSILGQTFRDLELVAVDDGSTDDSPAILDALARRDRRVVVLHRESTGIVGALEDGFAAARAKLVARMDADDVSLPDRIALQVAWMEQRPEVVALGTAIEVVDPFGSPVKRHHPPVEHAAIEARLLAGDGWGLVHASALLRRDAVARAGGYRRIFEHVEDIDLFLRLGERGRLANLPDVLFRNRHHLASINKTHFRRQGALKRQAIAEACARRGLPPPAETDVAPEVHLAPSLQSAYWSLCALRRGHLAVAARHVVAGVASAPRTPSQWIEAARSAIDVARARLARGRT